MIGKGTGKSQSRPDDFAADLEGDLEGEEGLDGTMLARMVAPFGDADASTRVRDECWTVWMAS